MPMHVPIAGVTGAATPLSQPAASGMTTAATTTTSDPRFCCSSRVLQIMHRTFLLYPVREIPPALLHVCSPIKRRCVVFHEDEDGGSTSSNRLDAKAVAAGIPPTVYEARFTWKAKSSRLVTLIKRDPTTTLIWDHASDTCFAAAPCVALGPGCPVGTALLGQVVMDLVQNGVPPQGPASAATATCAAAPVSLSSTMKSTTAACTRDKSKESDHPAPQQASSSEWIPNILVFDVIQLGDACNFSRAGCPAMQRYSVLLNLNHPSKGIFTSQHLKVQWAGELHSLIDFDTANRAAMPHIIEDYIRLGDQDPFEILFLQKDSSRGINA